MNYNWTPEFFGGPCQGQGQGMSVEQQQMMGPGNNGMMMQGMFEPPQSESARDGTISDKLIGPVIPEGVDMKGVKESGDRARDRSHRGGNDRRERVDRDRVDRDRGDRSDRGSGSRDNRGRRRSRSRERNDRSGRNHHDRRERKSKWGPDSSQDQMAVMNLPDGMMSNMGYGSGGMNDQSGMQYGQNMLANQNPQAPNPSGMGNMMMPNGAMMPYGNMMPQQMDMQHMPNMMQQGMGMMPNMQNMPNMMPGMMDQNMMMMNQQMMLNQQQIFFSGGVCLPPMPGTTMPKRRDKPPGCRTIFIGGLPKGITEDHLNELFSRFGTISEVRFHNSGICHIRYENQQDVEASFAMAGYRLKLHDISESDALPLMVDYALNRNDQAEHERSKRRREPTPPRVEQLNASTLVLISDKIKTEDKFAEAAPTLVAWLERGECNKKNANSFYSLIQASNNQIRRLYNDKMQLDEELQTSKAALKEKFSLVLLQFEQVAKILTAARHQRVSDHFTKQQRRNIEMWLRMTEELENIKEEFNMNFEENEDVERSGKKMVPEDKYEELKQENEALVFELEGYKNEAYVAKDEAERKFEKFKAHFIAQQALLSGGNHQQYLPAPPLPPPSLLGKPDPPPPTPDHKPSISQLEAKLLTLLTAFLLIQPTGASVDKILDYVKTIVPNASTLVLKNIMTKYTEIFHCNGYTGKWSYITLDAVKNVA